MKTPAELDDDVSKYLDDVAFDILEPTEAKMGYSHTGGWQEETDENSIVIACSKAASFHLLFKGVVFISRMYNSRHTNAIKAEFVYQILVDSFPE